MSTLETYRAAIDIWAEYRKSGCKVDPQCGFEVRNEAGELVLEFPFTEALGLLSAKPERAKTRFEILVEESSTRVLDSRAL